MEKQNLSIEEVLNEKAPCWYDEDGMAWCDRNKVIDAVNLFVKEMKSDIAIKDKIINKQAELIKFYENKLSMGEIHSSYNLKKELWNLGQKI